MQIILNRSLSHRRFLTENGYKPINFLPAVTTKSVIAEEGIPDGEEELEQEPDSELLG